MAPVFVFEACFLSNTLVLISCLTATWIELVSSEVPKPYLDEFFHVPQAQKYCEGDYSWDPKITTPPGLYLVSKLFKPLLGCETRSLRIQNAVALCAILPTSYLILRMLRFRDNPGKSSPQRKNMSGESSFAGDSRAFSDALSALNIALFPPLFFFSGLYYTDVMSTLTVLFAYTAYLASPRTSFSPIYGVSVVFSGIIALFFRQTNIFWVAVFPAGLAVVNALKGDNPSGTSNSRDIAGVLQESWEMGTVFDPPAQDAEIQDVLVFLLSIVVAALSKPLLVLKVAFPYATILVLFAGFVAWNGSVVLGDKSAHTATIHLPQMLYIWPYFAFFSFPLLLGPFFRPAVPLLPKSIQNLCDKVFNTSAYGLPSILASSIFVAWAILAVHFNTIIHPYTLADNRHYVFYVFKLLRLYPVLKYLAVAVYFVCARSIVNALVTLTRAAPTENKGSPKHKTETNSALPSANTQPCRLSFVVIWLAATALSIITAPLVEPRYFIIPWIIWRMHVTRNLVPVSDASSSAGKATLDIRMILETIWLLMINSVVSYIFLYRTFTWANEPGNLQRFIW